MFLIPTQLLKFKSTSNKLCRSRNLRIGTLASIKLKFSNSPGNTNTIRNNHTHTFKESIYLMKTNNRAAMSNWRVLRHVDQCLQQFVKLSTYQHLKCLLRIQILLSQPSIDQTLGMSSWLSDTNTSTTPFSFCTFLRFVGNWGICSKCFVKGGRIFRHLEDF